MQPPEGTTQARIQFPAVPPFELKGPLAEEPGKPGFDRRILGPGEACDRWQDSDAYPAWLRAVAEGIGVAQ